MKHENLYSIGHGNKSIEKFIEELKNFNIQYLIDIRSKPYSKFNQQFNQDELKDSLSQSNIKYTFLGKELGGLPEDPSCYTGGHVDYDKLKKNTIFKDGLKRLVTADNKGIKAAIMCSESKPEECHRAKLIGEELIKFDINLNHITKDQVKEITIIDQKEVMLIIAPNGKFDLFGEVSFGSRKKYK
jgi:uncharacterized protein (DUF488 family)